MLSCKDITEKTSEYVDKDMSLYQRMQFRLHLFMCHGCRRFVDQFKMTIGSVKGLEPQEVSEEMVEKQVKALVRNTKD